VGSNEEGLFLKSDIFIYPNGNFLLRHQHDKQIPKSILSLGKALKTVAPIIGEAIHYYKQNSTGQTTY